MNDTLREDIATIGTNAAALIIAALAVFGAIHYGPAATLGYMAVLIAAYLTVWGTLRCTTRPLRRPAPATAPTTDDDTGD